MQKCKCNRSVFYSMLFLANTGFSILLYARLVDYFFFDLSSLAGWFSGNLQMLQMSPESKKVVSNWGSGWVLMENATVQWQFKLYSLILQDGHVFWLAPCVRRAGGGKEQKKRENSSLFSFCFLSFLSSWGTLSLLFCPSPSLRAGRKVQRTYQDWITKPLVL